MRLIENVVTVAQEQHQFVEQYLNKVLADFSQQKRKIKSQEEFDSAVNRLMDVIFESFKSKYDRIKDYQLFKNIFLSVVRAKQDALFNRENFTNVYLDVNRVDGSLDSTQTYFDAITSFVKRSQRTDNNEIIKYLVQLQTSLAVFHKINHYTKLNGEKGSFLAPLIENKSDCGNCHQILAWINIAGKNLERYPALYRGKGEEYLRLHILSMLESHLLEGSITAETINKSGKTDIQIRNGISVSFIAECKFWGGERIFHQTIDQLFSYLTWQDTHAAIIFFVRQKEFKGILKKIIAEAQLHPNFLEHLSTTTENWFNFSFHLDGDEGCEVKLAIQLFHLS